MTADLCVAEVQIFDGRVEFLTQDQVLLKGIQVSVLKEFLLEDFLDSCFVLC